MTHGNVVGCVHEYYIAPFVGHLNSKVINTIKLTYDLYLRISPVGLSRRLNPQVLYIMYHILKERDKIWHIFYIDNFFQFLFGIWDGGKKEGGNRKSSVRKGKGERRPGPGNGS